MTIACIDVGYIESETDPTTAIAACVVINDWSDAATASEYVVHVTSFRDYQPGQFCLRQLPCIDAVLSVLPTSPTCIVIDGYVWLSDQDHPGLGKYLYDAMNQQIPVIGVAKNPFRGFDHAHELCRGSSDRPLYITSIGIPTAEAASNIAAMHGAHRFPSILKRVDRLSRGDSPAPKER